MWPVCYTSNEVQVCSSLSTVKVSGQLPDLAALPLGKEGKLSIW